MGPVQRGIGGQLLSRRSSAIMSRPESRRGCPDRRELNMLSARRCWRPSRHGSSQMVDDEVTSCRFAGLVVRSVGRHVRSLIAHRACGAWVMRLEVQPSQDGHPCRPNPKTLFNLLTLKLYRTTGGRARPGPAVSRPLGGLGGRLGRAFPPGRTRVPNGDWGTTRVNP